MPGTPYLLSPDTAGEILLMHTAMTAMGFAVTVILLRALLRLRDSGEALPGLLTMLWLMLGAEASRAVWLAYLWLSKPAPLAIDVLSLITGFTTIAVMPILVSARYLPRQDANRAAPPAWIWLERAMVAIAALGLGTLLAAVGFQTRIAMFLGPAAVYLLTALLLFSRFVFYRHLQIRRRPLLLFAACMIAGLLIIAGNATFSIVAGVRLRQSLPLSVLNFAGLALILCSIIFLLANVRMADMIVKHAMRIVLWTLASLAVWLAVAHSRGWPSRIGGARLRDLLCLLIVGVAVGLAPSADRRLTRWIEEWVFEQPDFQAAGSLLWREILELSSQEDVFQTTEAFVRRVLGVAAVRILPLPGGESEHFPPSRPGPFFVSSSSSLAQLMAPVPSVIFPLFLEGHANHAIALSLGVVRPPLTFLEMSFVEQVAGRVQIRSSMLSADVRARREASFREELTSAELRALRAQVNPHFLFNSLNTIADLTVIAPDRAEEMTVRLSSVFRYVLVNTDRHFSTLGEELEFTRSYLHIEQTRFGNRLRVRFDVDPSTLEQQIPTLLLQPLIENALKHGLAPRREGGTLTIQTLSGTDAVSISIADDGVGLRQRSETSERSTHVGLNNVRNRLSMAYGKRACFTLRQRESGGTEALIAIPRGQEA